MDVRDFLDEAALTTSQNVDELEIVEDQSEEIERTLCSLCVCAAPNYYTHMYND